MYVYLQGIRFVPCVESTVMLISSPPTPLPDLDVQVFDLVVPPDHYLRQVKARIDFERFRPRLAEAYSAGMGRPAIDPVRMLMILFLRFHYRLSDRQVMARLQTDMAFRWFLGLGLHETVPDHTNGTYFRKRIGVDRFAQIFQDLVGLAREHGLVRDRLRLKDATHMIADVADVRPLELAAQVREHLLAAATPFFPAWVQEQRFQIATLRQTTAELADDERLAARVEQLRSIRTTLAELVAQLPPAAAGDDRRRQRLQRALDVADHLLADRADPQAGDRLASAVDADARTGKHGGFFVGYLVDVAMDADSELITAVHVLPGNGAEAADAIALIQQEEAAQGNDVQALSIDGAGYNGPVLRTLTDPAGLNLDVTVPPKEPATRATLGPERFTLQMVDDVPALTCPQGQTTRQRHRNNNNTGYKYIFKYQQCADCPLRAPCLEHPEKKSGRTVIKNDYEAEYRRVEAKARTPEYQQTRRLHPKIERKLGELARHHGARRAVFRGQAKVWSQALLTALAVNIKRMVQLLGTTLADAAGILGVRAEPITT